MVEPKYEIHKYVLVNGDFKKREGSIDNYIPEILRKDKYFNVGVYDTARVQDVVLFVGSHAERLIRSAEMAGLTVPYNISTIINNAQFFAEETGLKQGRLLLALTADPNDATGNSCKLYIASSELPQYEDALYEHGATAILYNQRGARTHPKLKSLQRLEKRLKTNNVREGAGGQESLESIIVNSEGLITEGSKSNVFAIKMDGTLVTPPDKLVYDGVTREFVMQLARDNLKVVEENIMADSLDDYKEIFLASTSMGVMPVGKILSEGDIIYQRESFELTNKIRADYTVLCQQEIKLISESLKKEKEKFDTF